MTCSPEQTRLNAQKSTGPRSARGKAIISQNARKHGLLAEKPPLLASEDLETFQGLVQSLVDHYQPEGPIEWHLIQVIGMSIQRQHRVWEAEAAFGNAAIMPKPEFCELSYLPAPIRKERQILQRFVELCKSNRSPVKSPRSKQAKEIFTAWFDQVAGFSDEVVDQYPIELVPGKQEIDDDLSVYSAASKQYQEKVFERHHRWMRNLHAERHPYAYASRLHTHLKIDAKYPGSITTDSLFRIELAIAETIGCCKNRIEEIDRLESEFKQKVEEREVLTKSPVPLNIELLSRYEAHIGRQLRDAIEQLECLQQRRKA
jgi:hypothetical protein